MAAGYALTSFLIIVAFQVTIALTVQRNYTNALRFKTIFLQQSRVESFLTLYKLSVKDCVYECQIRTECQAVNYWRLEKMCQLLPTDTTDLDQVETGKRCVYIRKNDVVESSEYPLTSLCPSAPCGMGEACDPVTGQCTVKECRPHYQRNASVTGNVLLIRSRINVDCQQWYVPNYYSTCLPEGNWFNITQCEYQFGSGVLADCGEPPLVVNATASPGDTLQGAARNYTCDYGSDVINGSSTLVTCQENGMWTPIMFECVSPAVKVCSAPWFVVAGAGCYHTPNTNLINFTTARDYCASQHGYLVNMETAIENELLITYLYGTYGRETWWTGLSDEGIEGTYVWSQSGTPTSYFNWASTSEPSGTTVENYIVISSNKGWADYRVDMPALALCEAG